MNGRLNFVGNLYLPGPNFRDMYCVNTLRPNQIYLRDNIGPRRSRGDLPEAAAMRETDPATLVDQPFDTPRVATQPASEILQPILEHVGATLPARDSLDRRLIDDVRNRTGKIIDHPNQVGGWPRLAAGAPYPDANENGMSDEWEKRHGLDLNDKASGNEDPDEDGYTNFEEFLNGTDPNARSRG